MVFLAASSWCITSNQIVQFTARFNLDWFSELEMFLWKGLHHISKNEPKFFSFCGRNSLNLGVGVSSKDHSGIHNWSAWASFWSENLGTFVIWQFGTQKRSRVSPDEAPTPKFVLEVCRAGSCYATSISSEWGNVHFFDVKFYTSRPISFVWFY